MTEVANEEPYINPGFIRHQIRKAQDGIWGVIDPVFFFNVSAWAQAVVVLSVHLA